MARPAARAAPTVAYAHRGAPVCVGFTQALRQGADWTLKPRRAPGGRLWPCVGEDACHLNGRAKV